MSVHTPEPEGEGPHNGGGHRPKTTGEIAGPNAGTPLDPETYEVFVNIIENPENPEDTERLTDLLETFDSLRGDIVEGFSRAFDTDLTVAEAYEGINVTRKAGNAQLGCFLSIYTSLRSDSTITDSKTSAVLAHLLADNIEKLNTACQQFFDGCARCDYQDCTEIHPSADSIISHIEIAIDPKSVETDDDGDEIEGSTSMSRLSNVFAQFLSAHLGRIASHREDELAYKNSETSKKKIAGVLAEIGKIALGTAIGTSIALLAVKGSGGDTPTAKKRR